MRKFLRSIVCKKLLPSLCCVNNKPLNLKRALSSKMPKESFRLSDYDCIGFDLDNTVARYRVGAMMEMEYEILAKYLIQKGYSKKHLLRPVEQDFLLKGLIVDNENGNLLKIAADGRILAASHGTKLLNDNEIQRVYPNFHWEPTDIFAKDPLHTWNGPYSEKMRTLLDYFDIVASLVYARAVDSVDEEKGQLGSSYSIWPDLLEALQYMFNRDHFQQEKGVYFSKMKSNPEKYYYRCSDDLIDWFKVLKKKNKLLFLITGAYVDFASLTASTALGRDWREFFDIIVTYAKKPGFFTQKRDFIGLDGFKETLPIPFEKLNLGGIYTHGNWTDLHRFLSQHSSKENPNFLYIGDNLIQDIYTPNVYSHCDTVAVCEELQAEGMHGHDTRHPDKPFLRSSVWGSYFQYKNFSTNWYQILKDHSKICIPSLEYIAKFPLEFEHKCMFNVCKN
ncbi:5'-nucleotidase domain-containing protein 1-like [Harmonia axyridis]|uniref:5'-nucleotidase domain-containing protein 1-like n=1 Tax=Harmonia axyridis TaxID=115357 RepID=UPI001E275780|nr:5'-nucleotidase domain-containing protein 1-like [Harmonia axyridis]